MTNESNKKLLDASKSFAQALGNIIAKSIAEADKTLFTGELSEAVKKLVIESEESTAAEQKIREEKHDQIKETIGVKEETPVTVAEKATTVVDNSNYNSNYKKVFSPTNPDVDRCASSNDLVSNLKNTFTSVRTPYTNNVETTSEKREQIIATALESPEGRTALAQAMVEPIKTSLMYQGLARKLLMVDELRQGSLPRYERDIAVKSYVIPKRGANPVSIVEAEELLVPTLEISSNPTIRLNEIRQRRYYIVDRAQVRAKDSLVQQEDVELFKLLGAAVPKDHVVNIPANENLTPEHFSLAMSYLEEDKLIAAKIVMHPCTYKDIRSWESNFFSSTTQIDMLMSGLYGHLGSADVHMSVMCPRDTIYVLAPAQFVGVMPVRQDITVLSADDPKRLRLGWVVFEELGFSIINDYALAKIVVEKYTPKTETIVKSPALVRPLEDISVDIEKYGDEKVIFNHNKRYGSDKDEFYRSCAMLMNKLSELIVSQKL